LAVRAGIGVLRLDCVIKVPLHPRNEARTSIADFREQRRVRLEERTELAKPNQSMESSLNIFGGGRVGGKWSLGTLDLARFERKIPNKRGSCE
jgi:hypothetical protein